MTKVFEKLSIGSLIEALGDIIANGNGGACDLIAKSEIAQLPEVLVNIDR